jgi:hypothetical protein
MVGTSAVFDLLEGVVVGSVPFLTKLFAEDGGLPGHLREAVGVESRIGGKPLLLQKLDVRNGNLPP